VPIGLSPVSMKLCPWFLKMTLAASLHDALLYHGRFCKQWAADPTNSANEVTQEIPV
jgi:hypothetical protein